MPAVQDFTARLEGDTIAQYVPTAIPSPGHLCVSARSSLAHASADRSMDLHRVREGGPRWTCGSRRPSALREERRLLLDRAVVRSGHPLESLGGAEGFDYVATVVLAAPSRDDWSDLAAELSAVIETQCLEVRFGATALARGGLLARLLCPTAPILHEAIAALWSVARRRLLGLGPIALRKL